MGDQAKNILIGLFVVAAFAIVTFMLLFLHPTVGDDGKILKLRFADVDKVNPGTRVTYGGKPVGEVISIKEIYDPKDPRKTRSGYVYLYEIEATVDSKVNIYNSDTVSLKTSGLLGEKSIAITPLPPKPNETLRQVDKETIYAVETGSLEETLKEFKELSDKFEETLDSVLTFFKDVNGSQIVSKAARAVENIGDIAAALNDKELLQKTLRNIHQITEDAIATLKNFDTTITNANKIVVKTSSGEGTVGQLFMKDDIYLRFNSILSKIETLTDDVNHYGIFFQSDRNWQRVRARRANLLYTLESPQEFRNYFNDEVNQINTALSRVNQVLEQTSCLPCYDELADNCEYKKVIAELIRRVKMMEESIQMYNQQLMNAETCKTEFCE
jgi:phospholipid/cholesterol/gamma-HCH transport system substrate-binding protein